MVERIKTVVLWFLILLSVFLTIQIWTFQPNYAILKSTEYLEHTQIGEEKRLNQTIKPKQVVVHHDNHYFSPTNMPEFMGDFYDDFYGAVLEQLAFSPNVEAMSPNVDKIEFIFPTGIPIESIKEIFQLNTSSTIFINEVDQITFHLAAVQEKEYVYMKFISSTNQVAVEAKTNLSTSKFKDIVAFVDSERFYEVFPYKLESASYNYRERLVYLPVEERSINNATYLAKPISAEYFKQLLFSDPNFVKHYFQLNGEESFTDGNRMVNILYNGNVLRYINPTFAAFLEGNNKHPLSSSLDFLNAHGGLTNTYYFDSLKQVGNGEELTFRLAIDGIPVYHTNIFAGRFVFEIILQHGAGNQIEQYTRPMFFLDDEPINIINSTKLPSGSQLINALATSENFDFSLVTDISYGFMMNKRQSFVVFEPRWFIHYNGRWEAVRFPEEASNSEEISNGLE